MADSHEDLATWAQGVKAENKVLVDATFVALYERVRAMTPEDHDRLRARVALIRAAFPGDLDIRDICDFACAAFTATCFMAVAEDVENIVREEGGE